MSGHPSHTHQGARGLIIVSVTNKVEMNTPVDATIKGAAGVYQIRNLNNGKILVGSSVRLHKRWIEHRSRLNLGVHANPHLQASWKKYGEQTFTFEILITCHPSMCAWYEQQFLDQWKPEYNMMPATCGTSLGHKRSEETKRRISKAKRGVPNRSGGNSVENHRRMMLGNKRSLGSKNHTQPHSEKTKTKIREARARQIITKETREKQSRSLKIAYTEGRGPAQIRQAFIPWNKGKKLGPQSSELVAKRIAAMKKSKSLRGGMGDDKEKGLSHDST